MARLQHRKRKSPQKKWILTGLFLSVLFIVSAIYLLVYPFASPLKVAYFQGESPILFEGRQAGNALITEDATYVPLAFLKKVDESVHFDEKSNSLILATGSHVAQIPVGSLTYYLNDQPVKLNFAALKEEAGEMYIALEPLLQLYPFQYRILKNEEQAVWIQKDGDKMIQAKISGRDVHEAKLKLRTEPKLRAPYTAATIHKEPVYIEGEKDGYYYVRKENGMAGFINKNLVISGKTEKITVQLKRDAPALPKVTLPVNLTWEAVYNRNPDPAKLPAMPGVNVVSPTWFELTGKDGTVKDRGSTEYIKWAKKRGYQIWGLFSNGFDPELTHKAFQDFETRRGIIRQLLEYSKKYDLDGINIDIENVNAEDGSLVTQFIREGIPLWHEAGLIVSMDITFISSSENWSLFYERDQLAQLVDFLIVMAYDEYWATSSVAGSVASLPWVENNLQALLKIVPAEQLILGVPLYARLWKEQHMEEGGQTEVSSQALSMEKVKDWLKANNVEPAYDSTSGQNYAEFFSEKENATYKIWLEDQLSLKKRTEIARKYNLAGIASWSRYFADEDAWTALDPGNGRNVTKK